jgi:hypothetical protein
MGTGVEQSARIQRRMPAAPNPRQVNVPSAVNRGTRRFKRRPSRLQEIIKRMLQFSWLTEYVAQEVSQGHS